MRSRRYAKRQITFFKRFDNLVKYNSLLNGEFVKLCKILDNFLNNWTYYKKNDGFISSHF